jgi:two-component system cell cycle sensor histidine kinase/response regulator CckA
MSAVAKISRPMPDPKADPKKELYCVGENSPSPLAPAVVEMGAKPTGEDVEVARHPRTAERLETVGRLAGSVAHDFNNLLTGVLLYCDLILAAEPEDRVRNYAGEIRNAGMQASALVRQLLTVSRPTTFNPQILSLNEVAQGMHHLLARLLGETIDLKFCFEGNLGLVKIDPTHVQQILLNLALNARDAMPGGGQITIETRNCQLQILGRESSAAARLEVARVMSLPCALFIVQDDGSGMDAATRSHLFETFFTTKPAGRGTGLGLATVHEIVTSNGGLIHVETAPGRGTRVTVLLPVVETTRNPECLISPEKNEGGTPAGEKEPETN